MPIEIALENLPRGHAVVLRGRLDATAVQEFTGFMDQLIQDGATLVLLDCSELRYVASMGLGAFANYAKQLGAAQGVLAFAGLTPHVRSVFEMVGFVKIFAVYDSRQEALENPRFQAETEPPLARQAAMPGD